MNTKRILITGGAGFLGSHLCDKLLQNGDEVVCVDNYFTGNKNNIKHLMGNDRFELIRHDVTFPLYIEVDEIYNLACPASPIHYQHDPVQTTKTSVHGAINMLGLAKRLGAKILQASTSEVYGDPKEHPQTEAYWGNVNPVGIRACYDEGKRCAETLFLDYHRQHNLPIKILRIFNTYGPRMHPNDGRVVSNFVVQALNLGSCLGESLEREVELLAVLGADEQVTNRRRMKASPHSSRCASIQRAKNVSCWPGKPSVNHSTASKINPQQIVPSRSDSCCTNAIPGRFVRPQTDTTDMDTASKRRPRLDALTPGLCESVLRGRVDHRDADNHIL